MFIFTLASFTFAYHNVQADVPEVITGEVTAITDESAQVEDNVVSDGEEFVAQERGIVYATNTEPDLDDNVIESGIGEGTFDASISELDEGTDYYVRAYTRYDDNNEVIYGDQVQFTTGTPPTVEITSEQSDPTNVDPIEITFTFSHPIVDFDPEVVESENANLSSLNQQSEVEYVGELSPEQDGVVRVQIPENVVQDEAGVGNEASDEFVITSDQTSPVVESIETAEGISDPTNQNPIDIIISFDKSIAEFNESALPVFEADVTDVTVLDEDSTSFNVELEIDSGIGLREISIPVPEGVATDNAGNTNEPDDIDFSIVFDMIRPTVSLTGPEHGATNESPFEVAVTFSQDVIGFEPEDIDIDNGTLEEFTENEPDDYTVMISPIDTEQQVSLSVEENRVEDEAGNPNEESRLLEVEYDDSPLLVEIESEQEGVTNEDEFEVTIAFNKPVFGFDESNLELTNASVLNFTEEGEGIFKVDISPSEDGLVVVEVPAEVTTDAAGNKNQQAEPFEIESDRDSPQVTRIEFAEGIESPSNDDVYEVVIEFSEPVFGFEQNDIEVENGTVVSKTDENLEIFTAEIEPQEDGLVSIQVPEGVANDDSGNLNSASDPLEIISDRTPPEIVNITPAEDIDDPTNEDPFGVLIEFSEYVTDFEDSEPEVENASVTEIISVDSTTFEIQLSPNDPQQQTEIGVSIPEAIVTDLAGNSNIADDIDFSITYDGSRPTVTLEGPEDDIANESPFEIVISFSEEVFDFEPENILVDNGQVDTFQEDEPGVFGVTIEADDDGPVTITITEGVAVDAAGNLNQAADEPLEVLFAGSRPVVNFWASVDDPTDEEKFELTIIFSETVENFSETDLIVQNAEISEFDDSGGRFYPMYVRPQEEGLVSVQVPENSAFNSAGSGNEPAEFTVTYDTSPPDVTLLAPEDGSSDISVSPEFIWMQSPNALSYDLQISASPEFDPFNIIETIEDIEDTSYTSDQIELQPDSEYYWRVKGNSETDSGEWSEPWSFTTEAEEIDPPTRVSLQMPENDEQEVELQPRFVWDEAESAHYYEMQLATDDEFEDIFYRNDEISDTEIIIDDDLSQNQRYYWRVRAGNEAGESEWSAVFSFLTLRMEPDQVALESPIDSTGSIELNPSLTWNAADGADYYRIEILEDLENSETLKSIEDIEEEQYELDESLEYFETYHWRVQGYNDEAEGQWSEFSAFITQARIPDPLFPTAAIEEISIAPRLNWQGTHGNADYDVIVNEHQSADTVTNEYSTSEEHLELSDLQPDTEYSWRVRVVDELTTSRWSSPQTFTTRPEPSEQEQVSETLPFERIDEDNIASEDYRLIGLPGSNDIPLDEVFPGEYEEDWRAFSDNGQPSDFLVEYDPQANRHHFGGGNGFWIFNRESLQISEQVNNVEVDDNDRFSMNLHTGWNIITNPFFRTIDWYEVQMLNNINTELWGYEQTFTQTSELVPMEGYYFYNDPDDPIDELDIPYGRFTYQETTTTDESQEQSDEPFVDIEVYKGGEKAQQLTSSVTVNYSEDESNDGHTPHPSLENAGYGVALTNDEDHYSRAYSVQNSEYKRDGSNYQLRVKAPTEETLTWKVEMNDMSDQTAALLINPVTRNSHIFQHGDTIEIEVSEPDVTYELHIGDKNHLEHKEDELVPDQITLKPNYPNPFNPVTTIRYALTEEKRVSLEVYDALGRHVTTLVDQQQEAGWHTAEFDGSRLSSGTYIYRLSVGDEIKTGKMMLIK